MGSPEFSEKIVHWGLGSLIQVARNQNSHISPFGAGINNLFAKVYRVALPKHVTALFCEIEVRCSAEHGACDCSILQSYDAVGENSFIGLEGLFLRSIPYMGFLALRTINLGEICRQVDDYSLPSFPAKKHISATLFLRGSPPVWEIPLLRGISPREGKRPES